MVKPIHESLEKHSRAVQDIKRCRKEVYGVLKQQMITVVEGQRLLQSETSNLVNASRPLG